MTSEPDSQSRRRPPTIDLTATEVKDEQAAPEADAVPKPRISGRLAGPVGALIGAVIVAAIGAGLWFAGIVPARNAATASSPPSSAMDAISAQLNQIRSALAARPATAPAPADTALNSRVTALDAQIKALGDQIAALNRRLDGIAVAAQSAREHADAAVAAAQGAGKRADEAAAAAKNAPQNSVQRSDLDALANRIAALESAIKSLSNTAAAHSAPNSSDRAARAAVAAEALRATVDRGAPFSAELAAVRALGADQNAVAALTPFATGGVPTDAALAHQLAQLMPKLQPPAAPAPPPSSSGFLGSLESHAKSLVQITPVDAPVADSSSALGRLNADRAHADIAAALKDITDLPPATKTLAEPWVLQVNARDAALAASHRIAAAALAELAGANTQ
jgi:hypothetical protein